MLPKHDLELQTEAFVDFAGKPENRAMPLTRVFARWARSKGFHRKDERAIWELVRWRPRSG